MLDLTLPGLDTQVQIGETRFTRKQIQEGYNPSSDDTLILKSFEFGKSCVDVHSKDVGGSGFIFPDSQMAILEISAILYFDCLPEDHPIKGKYSSEDVINFLSAARLWKYRSVRPDYIN